MLGQGCSIGSYQRNRRVGIDWLASSLINRGDRVDFGVVPTPEALMLLSVAGIVGSRRRR